MHFSILEILEADLRGLCLETTDDLKEVMELGSFKCFWNRVYIVGPYCSGKSCLAKLLVGDALPQERNSTDGIWIYMGRAGMDLNNGEWIFIAKGKAVQEILVSMMMTLSTSDAIDTENLTTKLDKTEKTLLNRPVSTLTSPEEVVILDNSSPRIVHEERISQTPPRERFDVSDYTFSTSLSEENSHICDTLNVSRSRTVVSTEISIPIATDKSEVDGHNAETSTPLNKRTSNKIIPDLESNALGIVAAATNTSTLYPEESITSAELETCPSENLQKDRSTSEVQLEETSQSCAIFEEPGVVEATFIDSTDTPLERSIPADTALETQKSSNDAAGIGVLGVSSLDQRFQSSQTSNDSSDLKKKN
ncbi:Hypothetical predicted protein [Mytilus galloprovincialis]|uniref:Uncharacterized protein n=1 Tax=Mytilus galloprovincialis TaxID=29158 RepID=A0A8B6H3T6_MYTGA|nr:Hypothetical predicted protein [Mytilus galloprovincialis]